MLVEQRQVELEFARKVLVENRLADAGAFRDVVHRRGVVSLCDKDFLSCAQQLVATGSAWQARAPRACRLCLLDGCHAASLVDPFALCAAPDIVRLGNRVMRRADAEFHGPDVGGSWKLNGKPTKWAGQR
ncbi:hypothetical protein GCM10020367_42220 [Streptomyces sannanensis]|uniref:Uncharacterized protein n=1 Tax=Streptomyces sannanensis TaxID=285536 RepID=A0ABP6SFI5_9ACTN